MVRFTAALTLFATANLAIASPTPGERLAHGVLGHEGYVLNSLPLECIPAPNKTAPWFDGLSQESRKWFVSQKWYSDWLQTTTTLCTNLTKLPVDNRWWIHNITEVQWRGDSLYLFRATRGRGVHSDPQSVFRNGFPPWDQALNGSLMLQPGIGIRNSAIVSTTYSALWAAKFGEWLYVIDAPGGILAEPSRHLKSTPRQPGEYEVAFPGGILPKYIRGVYKLNPTYQNPRKMENYTANPNYWREEQTSPDTGHFDLAVDVSNPNISFSVVPRGEKVDSLGNIKRYSIQQQPITVSLKGPKGGAEQMYSNWGFGERFSTCLTLKNVSHAPKIADAANSWPRSAIEQYKLSFSPPGVCLSM